MQKAEKFTAVNKQKVTEKTKEKKTVIVQPTFV